MSAILAFEKPGKPVLRGYEHFWKVIRELDEAGPWGIRDIDMKSNVRDRGSVRDFVRRLVAGGMAATVGTDKTGTPTDAPRYRLSGAKPLRAPRLRKDGSVATGGQGQQLMWNVMRGPLGRDGFTFHDLALWGSTDEVAVSTGAAKSYVKHLARAGYLLQLKAGSTGKAAVWKLKPAMNTGPRPPLVLKAQIVVDQNRMTAMGAIEAEEASS